MDRLMTVIILSASLTFMVLPFYITFNELLTSLVVASGLSFVIKNYVAPLVSRMVASALDFFGLTVYLSGDALLVSGFGRTASFIVAWNCIGWQSLVIFSATAYLAFSDNYACSSKILALLVGLQGTPLFNVLRITLVALIALYSRKASCHNIPRLWGKHHSFLMAGDLLVFSGASSLGAKRGVGGGG